MSRLLIKTSAAGRCSVTIYGQNGPSEEVTTVRHGHGQVNTDNRCCIYQWLRSLCDYVIIKDSILVNIIW